MIRHQAACAVRIIAGAFRAAAKKAQRESCTRMSSRGDTVVMHSRKLCCKRAQIRQAPLETTDRAATSSLTTRPSTPARTSTA